MVGKIRNLAPGESPLKIQGVITTVMNKDGDGMHARAWPKVKVRMTENRRAAIQAFTNAIALVKNCAPEDYQAALDNSVNSPFLIRDLLISAAMGTYITFNTHDGVYWQGRSMAQKTIQPLLNSISSAPGSILVRGTTEWVTLVPTPAGGILLLDPDTGVPDWIDPATVFAITNDQVWLAALTAAAL